MNPIECPCCGSEAESGEVYISAIRKYKFEVVCTKCGLQTDYYDSEQEAVEAWNARAERTCSFEWVEFPEGDEGWCCSNCGDVAFEFEDAPNYCPNCGARVIGGEE